MNKLLKATLIGTITAIFIGLGYSVYYFGPKDIVRHIPSVIYQLGEDNCHYEVQTTVIIEAKLNRNLFKNSTLEGSFMVIGDEYLKDMEHYQLHASSPNGSTSWSLYLLNYYQVDSYIYGLMDTNKSLTEISIYKQTPDVHDRSSTWSGDDGMMVSGPAYTREQAVAISKKLTKYDLSSLSW